MLVTKQFLVPSIFFHTMEVNGDQQLLTIFFKISSKNSLEQLDGE